MEDFCKKKNIYIYWFWTKILEVKKSTCEMKNTLNGDNGRLDIAEEKISEREIETLENVEWKENY